MAALPFCFNGEANGLLKMLSRGRERDDCCKLLFCLALVVLWKLA